ncbi:HAD family hydrolase [Tepidibacillus infernus]
MEIQAVVLDLDGTLLNKQTKISNRNKEVLKKLIDKGVKVFLATGRAPAASAHFHQQLGLETVMICSNGTMIYDRINDRNMKHFTMPKEVAISILEGFKPHVSNILGFYDQLVYSLTNDQVVEWWKVSFQRTPDYIGDFAHLLQHDISKFEIFLKDRQVIFNHEELEESLSDQIYLLKSPGYIEIMPKGTSKWHALKEVLTYYDLDPARTIAFGDGNNDIEMITNVGMGVAMGNAIADLKQVAKDTTINHDEDGVAYFLEKYL